MAKQSPGLNGLCPRKSLSPLLLVALVFIALALPMVSAIGIDNWKSSVDTKGESFNLNGNVIEYNPIWETYKPIEIKNFFWQ